MDEEYARQLDAAEKQAAVDVSCIDGDAEPATPGAQFKFDLQALGNMMSHWQKSFPCQRCTTHIHGDMAVDVAQVCIVTTAQTDTTFMVKHLCSTSHLRCPTCYAHHCTGCHELLETTDDTENMVSLDSEEATHCPELRAWQVFQSLVYLDAVYLERKKNEKEPQKTVQKAAGSGVGYGRESYQDYHSKGKKPPIVESASMEEIKTLSSQNDQMLGGIFSALIRTLPDADADNIPDVLPHKLMPSILRLSTLPTTMRDLCRNDSVDDCASRSVLYFQLLALFNRLVSHEVGLRFLCEEHVAVSKTAGIWNVATGKGEIVPCYEDSGPDAPVALVKSIYTTLEQLMAQAALFLKYVQSERAFQQNGNEEDKKEDEDPFTVSEAISLCGCITSAGDAIVKALDGYMEKNTSETHPTSADQMYSEACKKLSFGQADLGAKSNYANHAFGKMIKTAPHYPAKIMLQISTLSTSLPQGIFVRIDETRLDVAKALIIGPEDTPYAHGLFEFDIYLGSEYPIQAPSVKGKTTGGGRVRFNPNLYHCGKVCLSLLGTWPGAPEEQWQPNRSTLLQVLTSIQCMILGIDKPYFNEPGCGQPRDSPESQAYNKNVRLQNVKLAMCDWLEKGKGSLWEVGTKK